MEDCVDTAVWKTKIERFELVVKPCTKGGRGEGTDGMLRGGKEEGGGKEEEEEKQWEVGGHVKFSQFRYPIDADVCGAVGLGGCGS